MTDTTKALNLPELPEPFAGCVDVWPEYTADQMHSYALAAIEADRDKREGGTPHILTESPFPEITGRTDKDVLRMCRAFLEDMHTMPVNWTISASVWLMNEVSNALNSSATRDGCVEMPREPSMAIVSAMKAQVQMKTTEAYKVYFAAIATAEKEKL